jgi:hypothetical protein
MTVRENALGHVSKDVASWLERLAREEHYAREQII